MTKDSPLLFELEAEEENNEGCGCDTYDDVTCPEHVEYYKELEDYYQWKENQ